MSRAGFVGLLLVISILLGGCLAPSGPSAERSALAQGESITILGSPQEEYVRGMARAFELETGIQTTYVRKSSGEALDLLRNAQGSPQFTVWWGGPADSYIVAAGEGLLEPYHPLGSTKVPQRYKDATGHWTGIYVGVLAFAVNARVLGERGLPEPKSWADLIKPEYQDLVSMAHPATSGTALTTVATVMQLNNGDMARGFGYLAALNKNVKAYERGGAIPARIAGRGEVAIAIGFAHDIVAAINDGYTDLAVVYPEEGTGYEIGGMGLVKDGPNSESGKRFIDWAMTERAQELGPLFGAFQIPTNPDARVPQQSVRLAKIKTIDYDFAWTAQKRDVLVERFIENIAPVPAERP